MKSAARELQVHTVCQMILAAIAAGAALFWLRSVLLPFILALFLVTGVAPVLHAIERRLQAPRMVAVAIAFLLGIGLFMILWMMVWLSVASLVNNADTYRQQIGKIVVTVERWLPENWESDKSPPRAGERRGSSRATRTGTPAAPADSPAAPADSPAAPADSDTALADSDTALADSDTALADSGAPSDTGFAPDGQNESPSPGTPQQGQPPEELAMISRAAPSSDESDDADPYDLSEFFSRHVGQVMTLLSSALLDLLSSAVMVLIFMFFLLLGDATVVVPQNGVWARIEAGIREYIVTKTLISVLTGAAFGLVLWLFGIPLALVFGLLAFLLNFIPNIGPIIASLLPLPLIVLHPELSVFSMVVVITLTSGIQFISGNVIEPKIMGESFELHPVAILLTLMFWGMLWGIVGMFLATPITAALKIFLDQFDHTRPVARWLEGRFS